MIADGTTVVLALCDRTAAHATPCAPSAAPHAQPVWASASDTVSAGGRIAKPMRRTLFDVNSISGLIFLLMSNLPDFDGDSSKPPSRARLGLSPNYRIISKRIIDDIGGDFDLDQTNMSLAKSQKSTGAKRRL